MTVQMLQVKLVRGAYAMYMSVPLDITKYKDYMNQASEVARPYFKEGWHLVHAMVIDHNF
jgi:hypothetical protein